MKFLVIKTKENETEHIPMFRVKDIKSDDFKKTTTIHVRYPECIIAKFYNHDELERIYVEDTKE